jgi:hypothetical protein
MFMLKNSLLLLSVSIFFVGCSTTYQSFEGTGQVIEGQGGTKEVIDNVDVWNYGTPPYKYTIIGVIDDKRPGGPLYMSSIYRDAVSKAKEAGGDAIIIESNESKVTGSYNTGSTGYVVGNNVYSGASSSVAVKKNYSRFLVIKYIH